MVNDNYQFPLNMTLLEIFQRQALLSPNATAIIEHSKQITYGQLNSEVNNLSALIFQKLANTSAENNEFVAILLPQSIDFIKSILAVWSIGKIPVPLSVDYPISQIKFILEEDLKNPILISNSHVLEMISSSQNEESCTLLDSNNNLTLLLDKFDKETAAEISVAGKTPSKSNEIAYCFFTSGSTGRPKGVLLNHTSYINVVNWAINQCQITSADRSLAFCSPVFDVSILEIWPILSKGGTLCIPPNLYRYDTNLLRNWMNKEKITFTALPTAVATRLLANVQECQVKLNPSLRWMLIGGEELTFYPSPEFQFEVINLYGPTEAAVLSTFIHLNKSMRQNLSQKKPSIGKSINEHVFIHLIDSEQQLLIQKPYEAGEIYIGGIGIAKGYLNRNELTNEKFIEHNFVQKNRNNNIGASRMYRTGDLGYWDNDGNLYFDGRIDSQVKLHGYRIELGNIEQALCQFKPIDQAVVVIEDKTEESGDKHLAAYCNLKKFQDNSEHDIILGNSLQDNLYTYLRSRLAHYEIPSEIYILQPGTTFPLTISGKINRKQLQDLESLGFQLKSNYEPLETSTEILLGRIWSEVLNISFNSIGKHDNFFSLGGNSIIALQVFNNLQYKLVNLEQEVCGIHLHHMFRLQTIFELAKLIDQSIQPLLANIASEIIHPTSYEVIIPFSRQQQLIWKKMIKLEDKEWFQFNQAISMKFNNLSDQEIMTKVIKQIINRHEILKYRLHFIESQLFPVFKYKADLDECYPEIIVYEDDKIFSWKDCKELLKTNTETPLFNRSCKASNSSLNLSPLVKFYILRTSSSALQVQIIGHQLLLDVSSFNLLFWEMQQLVKMKLGHIEPNVELELKPKCSYIDYINWQITYEKSSQYKNSLNFWKNYLENWKPLQFPSLQSNSDNYSDLVLPFQLDPSLTKDIRLFTKQYCTTTFNVLITAFKILIYIYTKRMNMNMIPTNVCGGIDVSLVSILLGREQIEFGESVGHFTQPTIIRTKNITNEITFQELLQLTYENLTKIFSHSQVPFEQIVEDISNNSPHKQQQLFTACIQMTPRSPLQLQSARNIFQIYESMVTPLITLTFEEETTKSQQFDGYLQVNSNICSSEQAQRFVQNFKIIITSGIKTPATTLNKLSKLLKI